ncbi:ABC transporter substrate-binding protein [Lachnospiraceae bacterium 54-53]
MRLKKVNFILAAALVFSLTACAGKSAEKETGDKVTAENGGQADSGNEALVKYPITISHAFGETVIRSRPERIATISWGNQDVPLALGVIPAGISEANYGVTDGSGLLPWTAEAFEKLGAENPVLFNDTDGLDYEAISDAEPDVILAAYSGITEEEYQLLSEIAPVVAYPTLPWQTYWRDQIIMDAWGMGMKAEGEELVSGLEALIAEKTAGYPQLTGKNAAFFYFIPSDLGKFYVYLSSDPRAAYLEDLGLEVPDSVTKLAESSESFAVEISAENADVLDDIDIIVAYGDGALLEALKADPLLGTIPAVKRGSVAMIQDGTPLAASSTPSALSIPAADPLIRW